MLLKNGADVHSDQHGTLPLHSGKVGISQKQPDGEPAAAARGPNKCQRQYYVVDARDSTT
jgi:hypothetical protein